MLVRDVAGSQGRPSTARRHQRECRMSNKEFRMMKFCGQRNRHFEIQHSLFEIRYSGGQSGAMVSRRRRVTMLFAASRPACSLRCAARAWHTGMSHRADISTARVFCSQRSRHFIIRHSLFDIRYSRLKSVGTGVSPVCERHCRKGQAGCHGLTPQAGDHVVCCFPPRMLTPLRGESMAHSAQKNRGDAPGGKHLRGQAKPQMKTVARLRVRRYFLLVQGSWHGLAQGSHGLQQTGTLRQTVRGTQRVTVYFT